MVNITVPRIACLIRTQILRNRYCWFTTKRALFGHGQSKLSPKPGQDYATTHNKPGCIIRPQICGPSGKGFWFATKRVPFHPGRPNLSTIPVRDDVTIHNETAEVRRVAVIGAGVAGLVATKSCLEEGIQPVCFEKQGQIGGTWEVNVDEDNKSTRVHYGLIMNISKELTRFSDFPMPESFPTFLTHRHYLTYLTNYATHFNILHHVRFNADVRKVAPLAPQSVSGRWRVEYENEAGVASEEFDAVIICSGCFKRPRYPDISGLEDFSGKVLHMQDVRCADPFKHKRVLIVGRQNSAGDAAVLASSVAEEVVMAIGDDGTWITPRLTTRGLPVDATVSRLFVKVAPRWLLNLRFKLSATYLPLSARWRGRQHPLGRGTVMINDLIWPLVASGVIVVKPAVSRVTRQGAYFTDGTQEGPFDVILFATGYRPDFSFIEWNAIQGDSVKNFDLYKWVFPLESERPTIAVIGPTLTFGAIPPVFELQARWVTRVWAGRCHLPPPGGRLAYWRCKKEMYNREFGGKTRNLPWTLLDEFSREIGTTPSFWKLFVRRPVLGVQYLLGPSLPAQYRLLGPGRNETAWTDSVQSYRNIFRPWWRKRSSERSTHAH